MSAEDYHIYKLKQGLEITSESEILNTEIDWGRKIHQLQPNKII